MSAARARIRVPRGSSARAQRGGVLFISLMALVILAILGAYAAQNAGMSERIVRNQIDRDFAFQAAEAALRDAEQWAFANLTPASGFSNGCNGGLCLPSQTFTPVWDAIDWTSATPVLYGTNTGAPALQGVAQQPRYVIELLPDMPAGPGASAVVGNRPASAVTGVAFRITAVAWGRNPTTQVMLQSVFVKL